MVGLIIKQAKKLTPARILAHKGRYCARLRVEDDAAQMLAWLRKARSVCMCAAGAANLSVTGCKQKHREGRGSFAVLGLSSLHSHQVEK